MCRPLSRSELHSFLFRRFVSSFFRFLFPSLTRRWNERTSTFYARVNRCLDTDTNEERANCVCGLVCFSRCAPRRDPELAENRRNPPPDLKEIKRHRRQFFANSNRHYSVLNCGSPSIILALLIYWRMLNNKWECYGEVSIREIRHRYISD